MSYNVSYLEKLADTPTYVSGEKQKKFTLAGYSACPAAIDICWFKIQSFGSNPERGTVSCPLIT